MADSTTIVPKKESTGLLERGFKSWSENTAITIRKKLGLQDFEPLPWRELADYLSVEVKNIHSLGHLELTSKDYLCSEAGDEWSAVTVASPEHIIVVANPSHSPARQSSSIMHELAHIVLEHEGSRVFITEGGFALRDYNEKQETEADWLAGTLLLPRTALQQLHYKHISKDKILDDFCVSSDLFEYRKRITGVNRQFNR